MNAILTVVVRAKGEDVPDFGMGIGVLYQVELTYHDITEDDLKNPLFIRNLRESMQEAIDEVVEAEVTDIRWEEEA